VPKEVFRDGNEPIVHFGLASEPRPPESPPDASTLSLLRRLETLKLTPAKTIADTCAAVHRTAKYEKMPGRSALRLATEERDGLQIEINVSKDALPRALLLADRLIQTAEAVGWTLTDPEPPKPPSPNEYRPAVQVDEETPSPQYARLLVEGEPIAFLIEERCREEPREPSSQELAREKREYRYSAPRITSIPTGALRIVRIDSTCQWSPRRKSWYDQGDSFVEQKIPKVLAAFLERAREIKAKRADDEGRAREWAEQERLKKEKAERRQAHAELRAELERQAGAWTRARFLRRYIAAARRALPGRDFEAKFRDERINFLDWATEYVDQLDPLIAKPLNPDLWPERSSYVSADVHGLKALLLRLTGFDGRLHRKLATIDEETAESTEDDDEEEYEDY